MSEMRALVVEVDAPTRPGLFGFLRRRGYQCVAASSESEAIDALKAGGATVEDIIKVTVWMKELTRKPVNEEWVRMFPDPASRPARQIMEVPMEPGENDRWQAVFQVEAEGRHLYTLQAWTDRFLSWSRDIVKKFDAAQDLSVDILVGAQLIEAAAQRASRKDGEERHEIGGRRIVRHLRGGGNDAAIQPGAVPAQEDQAACHRDERYPASL